MIILYRLIFLPALLVLLPFFLWRTRGRGGWRQNFRNRFGRFEGVPPKSPERPRLWLQAVSVGELLAIMPLIEPLQKETGAEIFLTTTTTTGFTLASERLAGRVLRLAFFPVDFWPWSARAWRTVDPDLVILAEGERWPEHIGQAQCRGVPVVCVNARLSERGFRRARRLRALTRPWWRGITHVLAGTETDAQRFRAIGFEADRVQTTGSIKLDVEIPRISAARQSELRRELGLDGRLLIVGASTWPGEEAALLAWLRRARAEGVDAQLLIVPRHVERRGEIAGLLEASGYSHHFRSRGAGGARVDVAVGDTTGELRQFLQLADVVLVGRSLPPHHEGQTPIEAAILGQPILFGPGMGNFRDLAAALQAAGGAIAVRDADDLGVAGTALLCDSGRRAEMGDAARAWIEQNRGAIGRTVTVIRKALGPRSQA